MVTDMTMTSTSVPTNVVEFRDWLAQRAPVTDEASAIDQIRLLNQHQGMIEAAQALAATELETMRLEREAREKVPKSQRGKGLGAEIALARRETPARGKRFLEMARALAKDMPHTREALTQGQIREEHAQAIVKETSVLSSKHRKTVDDAVKDRLGMAGPKELANEARAHAQRLDPKAAAERTKKGTAERRVTCQPIGDGLSKLTAIGPSQMIHAVYNNLWQSARSILSTGKSQNEEGKPRTRDQLTFDLLIERGTGQPKAAAVPVQVLLSMSPESLTPEGHTPAWLVGHGPIPAKTARKWLGHSDVVAEIRRLFTTPKGNQIVGLEAKSRNFSHGLRTMVLLRDDKCRNIYCEADIQDSDHMKPHREDGPTSWDNGSGLCTACNQTKENRGWKHEGDAQSLTVTTPTGHTYTKTPGPVIPGTAPLKRFIRRRGKRPDPDDADPDEDCIQP